MTNEQKLTKLLQIAVENGYDEIEGIVEAIDKHYITLSSCEFSLNDLVLDWEHEKLGFISALLQETDKYFRDIYLSMMVRHSGNILTNFHVQWVSLPTSQRLEYLFETFKHLL